MSSQKARSTIRLPRKLMISGSRYRGGAITDQKDYRALRRSLKMRVNKTVDWRRRRPTESSRIWNMNKNRFSLRITPVRVTYRKLWGEITWNEKVLCSLVAGAALQHSQLVAQRRIKSESSAEISVKQKSLLVGLPSLYSRKAEDGVKLYENQLLQLSWKSKSRYPREFGNDTKSGPEKITTAIEAGTAQTGSLDAPGRIIQYGKMENWLIERLTGKILSKMLQ